MTVEDPDAIVASQKKTLTSNLTTVNKALESSGLSSGMKDALKSLSSALSSSLSEITTLEKSDQVYSVSYNKSAAEGDTHYDLATKRVMVEFQRLEALA